MVLPTCTFELPKRRRYNTQVFLCMFIVMSSCTFAKLHSKSQSSIYLINYTTLIKICNIANTSIIYLYFYITVPCPGMPSVWKFVAKRVRCLKQLASSYQYAWSIPYLGIHLNKYASHEAFNSAQITRTLCGCVLRRHCRNEPTRWHIQ